MNNKPFNVRSDAVARKSEPGEGDDAPCVKCGAVALDTGLECSECGHDNYEAIYGKPFGASGVAPSPRGLEQAARQALAALKRWRATTGEHPHAHLIYEACSYLEPHVSGATCTEPNRAACPRKCIDFCNKAEQEAAAARGDDAELGRALGVTACDGPMFRKSDADARTDD